ncbi:trace amine associated receptor 14f [Danio rerio]|uniref:Trace amine-associated receptor 14f n=1 Tax=Danio rerio TaxID=7955 RepID=Q5RG93_DANRE|nr:trace amine associated receptor 14f [Danio rerio]|eukprot:NP_001076382.1 trace amine associated receptor 14f [Danio rerio]
MNLTAVNQTDMCEDYSCPERSVSLSVYVILYVAAAAVALLTVCGNLLVIISVSHFKQLHTPANILILSLAASDLLVGVFVIPLHLSWVIESCWISGPVVCLVFKLVNYQATSVSVHTVALIAVDRFLALSFPFFYSEKISLTVVCTAALLNWLFSLIYNFTLFYVNENFTVVVCPGVCFHHLDGISSLIDLLIVFVMPCTLIIILYTHVFVIAKKHATAIRALQVHNSTESSKNKISDKSERKAAMLLGILVFVFLLCLLPYYITFLVIPYGSIIYMYVINVAVIFFFLNSTINPIIYALFYSWFKKSLKLIFTFKVFHKDSSLMNVM